MPHNPYAAPQADLKLQFEPADGPRLFAWHGRIGRVRYLAYCLLGIPMAMLFGVAAAFLINLAGLRTTIASYERVTVAMGWAVILIFVLAVVAATRRRLHDFDVGGWAALFLLFPILQFVFVIYLLVAPGMADTNRFGPAPPSTPLGMKVGVVIGCLLLGFTTLRFL